MADEHVPSSSPHSSTQITPPLGVTPSPANVNGTLPNHNDSLAATKDRLLTMTEWTAYGRWMLGCVVVLAGGWGILGLALYLLLRFEVGGTELIFAVLAALDLGLFLYLERDFWLSRFMGLRIDPGAHAWHSAILLWLFGLLGLLFRPTQHHPEFEARAEGRSRLRPVPAQRGDSVREVVETIVFVVVLVLLLKSFAAEAFVIPTGSMAQTLLGYQKEVKCPDCELKFPINCSQEVDPTEGGRPSAVYACVCPNCGQQIHFPSAPQNYAIDFPNSMRIEDPGWNSGDRVLVAKFVYDLFNKNPERLDVVVFKYPGDSNFPHTGPHRNHVPMNYIKRCIGLPGETIAIRGGKLYFLSPDKGLYYDDYEKAKQDPDLMATLWKKNEHMHMDDPEAHDRFKNGQFQIIRKSPEKILSMMRLVFDNDHSSKSNPALTERWTSRDRSWSAQGEHGFRREGGAADQKDFDWLTYRHVLRDMRGNAVTPALITDIMGYNTYQSNGHSPLLGQNWVGDLILECEASFDSPQGELALELSRGVDRFQARWDLSTGTCTLVRLNRDGEQKLESKPTPLHKKGSYRLRFANVDQRLVVWVNDDLMFDNGVTYPAPTELAPQRENDFERPAGVGVRGAGVSVQKLRLFRDTYYTVGGFGKDRPSDPDVQSFEPNKPDSWTGLSNPPLLTLYVQPEHFLCLGDNSPESSDGRSWGAVPRRLLLGRALLVYYPFSRAGRIR